MSAVQSLPMWRENCLAAEKHGFPSWAAMDLCRFGTARLEVRKNILALSNHKYASNVVEKA